MVNAAKIKLTGNKMDDKFYNRHSGIPGGFKATSYRDLLEDKPTFPVEKAVNGHAPEERSRPRDVHQAEGLRDAGSSARRPEAHRVRDQVRAQSK